MTSDVLRIIKDTYNDILKNRIEEANELYEEIWEEVLEYFADDPTPDNIIEVDVFAHTSEDNNEVNDLLFMMLKQDGFKHNEDGKFTLPASVIICLANQQEEGQQLKLKNHK